MIQKYKRFVERVDDEAWEGTDQDWNDDWAGGNRRSSTPLPSRFDMSGEIADDDDFYDSEYYGGIGHNFNDYDNRDTDWVSATDRDPDLTDDDIENDDMEHLKYLLRGMFKNKGFHNVSITNDSLDLTIRCNLSHRERLSDLISLFDLVNKLKTDILPQYDSDYETWESQRGQVMEFCFYYDEGLNDDTDEDYGEDDQVPF
jgi:hypothetical protein